MKKKLTYKKTSSALTLDVSNSFPDYAKFDKETEHALYKN